MGSFHERIEYVKNFLEHHIHKNMSDTTTIETESRQSPVLDFYDEYETKE